MAENISDFTFEEILPWDTTGGDTGLSSRLKLKRNFDKVKAMYDRASGLYLSKVHDDTANGFIKLIKGLQVGERFVSGLLGEGGVFRREEDGTTYIEADKLYIRMKAYFDTVEIRDYRHSSGNRIASPAGMKCIRVVWFDASGNPLEQISDNLSSAVKFRCFFRARDGENEVRNNFVVGDQAYCHITTVETAQDSTDAKGLNMRHYWRLVIGKSSSPDTNGEHWIDLSNAHDANGNPTTNKISGTAYPSFQSGSDVPQEQDDIIQLGNVNDNTRQGAIVEFVTGADSPSYQIFQGINTFSTSGKNYVNLGYATGASSLHGAGHAFLEVMGDFYFGAKPTGNDTRGSTYIHYQQDDGHGTPRLDIKANVTFTSPEQTYGTTDLNSFIEAVTNDIGDLQDQIDGEIDTWYYSGVPTLDNAPAEEWTTPELKQEHLGDLYYDKDTGYAYRFVYDNGEETFLWTQIHDDAISEALRIASDAQDTADKKRRVFLTTPTPPYDEGDLWVNAVWPESGEDQGTTYNNDLLKCKAGCGVPRTVEVDSEEQKITSFSIDDWDLASGYGTALKDFIDNTYNKKVVDLETQIDGKAETWYQKDNPAEASGWKPSEHVGDLWYCTDDNEGTNYKKGTMWFYKRSGKGTQASPYSYAWVQQDVPEAVFDKIDGKAAIYVNNPDNSDYPTDYHKNDLWILPVAATVNGTSYKRGEVLTATQDSKTYNAAHWEKKVCYTDDSGLTDFVNNTYDADKENLQNQIDGKYETWFYDYAPVEVDEQGNPTGTTPLSVQPFSKWNTNTKKKNHIGDLFWDRVNKHAYRFVNNGTDTSYDWAWEHIGDNGVIGAMAYAEKAQDTADNKRRVFVTKPTDDDAYDVGDLWVNATYPAEGTKIYDNDLLKCKTAKAAGANFDIAHWEKASSYTNDAALTAFLGTYINTTLDDVMQQIDQKAETWYQEGDPAATARPNGWLGEDNTEHKGDIWHNTSSSTVSGVEANRDAIWNGTEWQMSDVPQAVYDTIDGKADIFVTRPTTYNKYDIWIIEEGLSSTYMPTDCQSGDIVISSASRTNNYKKADWSKKDRYTDDTYAHNFDYLKAAMKGDTSIQGGLLLSNTLVLRNVSGSTVTDVMSGINGVLNTSLSDPLKSIAAWYGGDMVDYESLTTAQKAAGWGTGANQTRFARSLFRFDGSGYVASGNISWSADGTPTIKGDVIDTATLKIGGTTVNLSDYVTLGTTQTITAIKAFTGGLVANRIYLYKPNLGNDNGAVYLEYSSAKQGVCLVGGGLFTNSYLSAHGAGSGGGSGSVSLNQPLSGINSAGLPAPTAGQALVYNGSEWKYSNAPGTKLSVGGNLSVGGTVTGTMFSGAGFKISGLSNGDNYVLLAGGGKVALSDIGSGSYLPLSGGTMTGTLTIGTSSLATQLTILRKHDSNGAFIEYSNNSGRLGLLGFSSNGLIARLGTDTTNLTVWHSGNFTPSDYVPTNSTRSIVVGGGNYNFYSPSSTALNLDSVYGRVSKYTSGGGIDADNKVDINTLTTPGVYAGNGSYYYIGDPSVALPSTTYFRLEVSVTRGTGSGTYLRQRLQYYNGYVIRERRSADGGATWTDFAIVQRDLTNYPSISNSETANYVFATPNGSAGVPSFRHIVPADIYTHSSTGDITNDNTEFFSSYQSDDGFNNTTHGNKIYRRPVSALWAYTKSKMTADTTLNVASATKLQTARTLWGQSFDGTADVSGSITGATSITATGLTTTKTLSISSESAVAHLIFSRGGNNYITAPSGGNISFVCGGKSVSNANRDMYISDGAVNITGTLNVSSNSTIGGTLGVTGVTTLGGALDVTGAATLSSTLAVTGDTTLGSTLYVNGTTVSQTIRAKTDKTYNLGSSSYYWKYLYVTRIYLASGVYLEYNSNKAGVHLVGAGLYSDSFLSAHGAGSGGGSGSVSLNQPLSGINSAGLAAPNSNLSYQAIVWTGSKWDYSINTTILANKFLANTDIIVQNGNLKVNYGRAAVGGAINSDYKLTVYGAGLFGNLAIGHTTSLSSVQLSCVTVEAKNNPLYLKTAIGYVYASAAYSNQSDIRLKDIVGDVNATVEDIAATHVFNFRWKRGDDTVMLGTSAQDWQRVLPYAVSVGPEGYLTLDYAGAALAATVITARKVVDHERRIAKLEAENKRLRKEIRELKSA